MKRFVNRWENRITTCRVCNFKWSLFCSCSFMVQWKCRTSQSNVTHFMNPITRQSSWLHLRLLPMRMSRREYLHCLVWVVLLPLTFFYLILLLLCVLFQPCVTRILMTLHLSGHLSRCLSSCAFLIELNSNKFSF